MDTDVAIGEGVRDGVIEQCFPEFFPVALRKTESRKEFRLSGSLRVRPAQ
jgi:hypothetical protein